jgi:hypothetical protein
MEVLFKKGVSIPNHFPIHHLGEWAYDKACRLLDVADLPEDTHISVTDLQFKLKDVLFNIVVYKDEEHDVGYKPRTGYMCTTDFAHELGECTTSVYSSVDSIKEDRKCVEQCGIIRVEVQYASTSQEPSPLNDWSKNHEES